MLLSTFLTVTAACGGGAESRGVQGCAPSSEVAADVGRGGAGTAIAVAALDDRFDPACVDIPTGAAVTIVVRNAGRHPHNLTLPDGRRVAVDAGQVAILDATVVGALRYTCTIHPGMDGEVRATA